MDMLMESAPVLVALGLVLLVVCMRPQMLLAKDDVTHKPICCKRLIVAVILIAIAVVGGQYLMADQRMRF